MFMPQERIRRDGIVQENLSNGLFRVELQDEALVLAHLSGKMRLHHIKVVPGDRVTVELSPYDQTKGRIVLRTK
ncbi:MAG: translation initiation factor IF-1 [Candidatus Azambacteria bacterium]|nr:translation initiation factor IF-1 [Candidatus Azambacteria bacterium]